MRLATWNVNSIRARVTRTVEFCVREHIDVLAMQEIKCKTEQFPYAAFEEAGVAVCPTPADMGSTLKKLL